MIERSSRGNGRPWDVSFHKAVGFCQLLSSHWWRRGQRSKVKSTEWIRFISTIHHCLWCVMNPKYIPIPPTRPELQLVTLDREKSTHQQAKCHFLSICKVKSSVFVVHVICITMFSCTGPQPIDKLDSSPEKQYYRSISDVPRQSSPTQSMLGAGNPPLTFSSKHD